MKRFLYLDCDGILNGCTEIDDFATHWPPISSIRRGDPFNKYKVDLLAKLVNEHSIEVIGISSWFGYRREAVLKELGEDPEFKLPIHRIGKCTTGSITRCESVLEDVMEHKPDYWCILDDGERNYYRTDHPFYDNQPYFDIRGKLVAPRGRYGLNEEHIEQVAMLLGLSEDRFTDVWPLGWVNKQLGGNK